MRIHYRRQTQPVAPQRLAAVITPSLLQPTRDDAPPAPRAARGGGSWVRWGDAQAPASRPLD